jgi:hypothetical protein
VTKRLKSELLQQNQPHAKQKKKAMTKRMVSSDRNGETPRPSTKENNTHTHTHKKKVWQKAKRTQGRQRPPIITNTTTKYRHQQSS